MPNHIQNRLKILTFDKVKTVFNALKGKPFDDGTPRKIDFNKIIPQPANIFLGDLSNEDKKHCEAQGIPNWYDWNTENWGTKWGAYSMNDKRDTPDTIHFQTAWSVPEPVVEALAKMFPDVEMQWDYADEDSGSNTGRVLLKDGVTFWHNPENQSNEAYEIYFDLHPEDRENFELVDGEYKYKNED
jgi:hypothetical protein